MIIFSLLACGSSGRATGETGETGETTGSPGASSAGFEVFTPIDIPVTVSKTIPTIDPTSLEFTSRTGDTGDDGGSLSGEILNCDPATAVEGNVCIIFNNAVVTQATPVNCEFEIDIEEDQIGSLLGISVIDNNEIGTPLVIKISMDAFLQIFLTDLESSLSNHPIAIGSDGKIAFQGTDSDGNKALGEFSLYSRDELSVKTFKFDDYFDQLEYNYQDTTILYGVDANAYLYQITDDDWKSVLNDDDLKPVRRRFSFSYDDAWLVTNIVNSASTETFAIVNLDDNTEYIEMKQTKSGVSDFFPDWIGSASIYGTRKLTASNGTVTYEGVGNWGLEDGTILTESVLEDFADGSFDTGFTSSAPFGPPAGSRDGMNPGYFYTCEDDDGSVNLCMRDTADGTSETVVSGQGDVSKVQVSPERTYAVFEIEDDNGTWIGIYRLDSESLIKQFKGYNPAIFPTDENIIVYQCEDPDFLGGKLQLCLMIMSNIFSSETTASSLVIEPPSGYLFYPAGACLQFDVTSRDADNSNQDVGWTTRVNLSGTGITFYSDSCVTEIDYLSIEKDTSSHYVTFRINSAGNYTMTASDNSGVLANGTYNITISENENVPTRIHLGMQDVAYGETRVPGQEAGYCYSTSIWTKDNNQESTKARSAVTVLLSGGTGGTFYSDSLCQTSITSATIAEGSSITTVYYKNIVENVINAATTTVTGSDSAGNLTSESVNMRIVATPAILAVSGPTTATSGACTGPYTATSKSWQSIAAPVSSARVITSVNHDSETSGFTKVPYSDSSCATNVSSSGITMASGSSQVVFYVKMTLTGDPMNLYFRVASDDGTATWIDSDSKQVQITVQ